ncbi:MULTISPECIES: tripartite tricarboxylate transporter substrate binding protein [unclassified Cupriavidus]|uniref:tripartite tricarboxylate transporter substrate binding protein n=1 Tax=Cupriavidus sp. H19C3 TaxID=3241603 RepID=UPI003BF814E5
MSTRAFFRTAILAAGLAGAFIHQPCAAAPDNDRPIRLVVPYPAGGGADGLARLVGKRVAEILSQPVVIENKPGANTMLASTDVARRAPDGLTLLYVASSFSINPSLYNVPYDTERDFVPVALVAKVPLIIIRNLDTPYATLADLLAAAKARPGRITFASYGQGSPAHLGGELLESMAGVQMKHIPYKGSSPALTDLMGGHVEIAFSSIEPALQLLGAKKVAPIAVMTRQRIPQLPDVPAVAETIPGFEAIGWNGIVAPKGTPAAVVGKLNAAINEALTSSEIREHLARQGVEPGALSPDAFGAMIRSEIAKWSAIVKTANVKVE